MQLNIIHNTDALNGLKLLPNESVDCMDWKNFPAQSPVCGRNDGLSDLLDPAAVFAKSVIDRHRNPVPRWRIEAIKCYGNAIVPQVAYRVLHTIRNYINAQLQ